MIRFLLLFVFASVVHFFIVLLYNKTAQVQIGCHPTEPECIVFSNILGHRFAIISVFLLVSTLSLSTWRGPELPIVPTTTIEDIRFATKFFLYGGILSLFVYQNIMRHIQAAIANGKAITSRNVRWRVNGINFTGGALFITSIFLIMRLIIHVS